jgi:hypothetical protein
MVKNFGNLELIARREPKRFSSLIVRNPKMMFKKRDFSYEQCMEVEMTPAQRQVFSIVDEWWKKYGCSSALRQIVDVRGKSGIGFSKDSQKT